VRSRRAPRHHNFTFLNKYRLSQARFSCVALLLLLLAGAWGCKNPKSSPLPPARLHSITRELESAAKASAPSGSAVRVTLNVSDGENSSDHLDITLSSKASDDSTRGAIARLQQSLGTIATREGLTEEPGESGDGILFRYKHAGVVTHTIHIRIGTKAGASGLADTEHSGGAKLAIILDDLGSDRTAADEIFSLRYPLTLSVLPNHPHSIEIAQEAHQHGYEVMLHLPMESIGKEQPEAQELRPGMSEAEISALVGQFLQNVPNVVGVNNHQGSQATSDEALMTALMPVLRDRDLFYIDSRTTAATVAFKTAQQNGVRTAFRNVPFLDDVAEIPAVRKQLELAIRGASEKGEAIAIGHPHPATLEALRQVLPEAKARGVRLVFASELVH
jgi:uncharacterized protein